MDAAIWRTAMQREREREQSKEAERTERFYTRGVRRPIARSLARSLSLLRAFISFLCHAMYLSARCCCCCGGMYTHSPKDLSQIG